MQGIERREQLVAAEGELRGFDAAAPAAGQHAGDTDAAPGEGLADAHGLGAALRRKIALGGAVVEPEIRRIADPRRLGVADQRDMPALLQQLPSGLVRRGGRRRSEQQDEGEKRAAQNFADWPG
jgi:hypothetical protein